MIDWQRIPLLGYDTETSGVDPHQDRVVTVALDRHWPDRDPDAHTWLLNPGIEIPDEAAAIHGVSTAHAVEHGQDPVEALTQVADKLVTWMGRALPVVAFNAAFDFTMIESDLARRGLPTLTHRLAPKPLGPVLDPNVIDKFADQYRPGSRTLAATCEEYGVTLEDAHTADADARAAVLLTRAIFARHRDKLAGYDTLAGIYRAQAHWRKVQMIGLRNHHRREGKLAGDYDYGWPIHTNPGPDPIQAAEQATLFPPVAPSTDTEQGALL